MEARDGLPVIPMRKSRKRRIGADRSLYRPRNLVERSFHKLKNARRATTPRLRRHHLDPTLAPPFVNMT
jgi:transposase